MKLTFINHASCKVQTNTIGILMDTWMEGPAFNFGWDLLIPTPFSFDQIMEGVDYVWISHEHPDHFSVPFLIRLAKTHKDKVTILFQKTRDHRVVNFCAAQGLRYQELEDRVPTKLSEEVSVTCGVTDFYDSWLNISDGKDSILNLNDCHTRTDKDVTEKIIPYVPRPTLLLSQFSYASWKGGKENTHYRATAARQKLETLARQIRLLKPTYTFPFASMIYFSNVENSYMNDLVNTPAKAAMVISESGSNPIVLYPADSWELNSAHDNSLALARYNKCYEEVTQLPLREPGKSANWSELTAAFEEYQSRVFAKNSKWLIQLVAMMKPLKAFQPLSIELYDIDTVLSFSVLNGMERISKKDLPDGPDMKMHSSSMMFILKNDFGFDTLMVNGRLETSRAGFSKMTKSLAIGSLNAMGLSLSPRLLLDFQVIVMLLNILAGVLSKLRQSEKAGSAKATEQLEANKNSDQPLPVRSGK